MRFSLHDVQRFAAWSHDQNPLHVDARFARETHFGRPVVHGVLTVLEALRSMEWPPGHLVKAIDVEFRSAAVAGEDYRAVSEHEGATSLITVGNARDELLLNLRAEAGPFDPSTHDSRSRTAERPPAHVRAHPAEHALADFERGIEIAGAYPAAAGADGRDWERVLPPGHARVLALCSYITGMEVPGLRSLFTRLAVRFHDSIPGESDLCYRARTGRFDPQFRLLETHVDISSPSGAAIATALLRSYVPFSPATPHLTELAAQVQESEASLRGKVALVLGGSRGLGAELAAGLSLAGCRVYASTRDDSGIEQPWVAELRARSAQLEFLRGDPGDPAWCRSTVETLRARHGRFDVLVLNACAPPGRLRFDEDSAARYATYINSNLQLVDTPLAASITALEESDGTVVCISSSFVESAPTGYAHYVAVKQAAETLVRSVCRERPRIAGLTARPPMLQTRWNDTPAAVVGAIPVERAAVHIIKALARDRRPGDIALVSEYPPLDKGAAADYPARFRVRIAGTFTVDPIMQAMRFWAKELDAGVAFDVAPYGQLLQSLLDPASMLNASGRGHSVIFLRVRDWLRELPPEQAGDIEYVKKYLQETTRDVVRAFEVHRGHAPAETLLIVCPSYGAASSAESILLRQAEADLLGGVSALPGMHTVVASDYHLHYGVNEDDVHDSLRDELAHIPYADGYMCVLGTVATRHVHRRLASARKVVAVDCDNTLWRGVVGEVGAEGIEFDEGHRALHQALVRLAQSGVLVCLCSKNEEADVWRVFETRHEMALRREHVVAAAINWLPKSQNLRSLAARLNLGLDSFVFIDDNPVECAEVRAGCPEILTLEWPQDSDEAVRLLQHVWELDPSKATKEDERRTEMYRQEFRRQQARAETLTFADFLDSLQLVVDIEPLAPEEMRRAAQLTLRTNQFNFTTIRREEADLQALVSSGTHDLRTIRVRDRFGDYGLVGLMIVECQAETWTLDTFLLSCRVLGRGVEHRIVADLGRRAAAAGVIAIELRVEETKRNAPARSFFDSLVPADLRGDHGARECAVPPALLAAVRFEPAAAMETPAAAEGGDQDRGDVQSFDAMRLRRREEQIRRAAFELATGDDVRAAVEGRAAAPGDDVPSETGIAALVRSAFAHALRIPAERVAAVDNLEALGCDSLRIVETTVALKEKFPWIPSTLLFEHKSVSAIACEIAARAMPARDAGDAPAQQTAARAATRALAVSQAADIAVVGMHVRCAGADSVDDLWELLRAGRSAVGPVPRDRRHFLQPFTDSRPHWAGLIDDPGQFDAAFFGVSPREAEFMDPQLRLFLEVAWGALEDAGCAAGRDPDTGVFAGVMYADYGFRANLGTGAAPSPYRCWEGFSLANRLSQLLGFHGPSLAVDTACSSSGTALHLACAALKAGECRAAIVGGVNLILDPDRFASLGRLGILSLRGRCEPFGADADGTVLGEGAAAVVLRPLDEALRRGDRIYGVIKGSALSTGSGTVGFTAPNPHAQADAIRRALRSARVDPRTVSYIETHGTGTALGDPIEVRGLALGYGSPDLQEPGLELRHRASIGSIKPNIGHLEAGAGVLGLIKVLLQLTRRTLLPSLTSAQPNPQIPFADGPFDVQRTVTDWRRLSAPMNGATVSIPLRAGLSSFGVGGANVHIIVEEGPETIVPEPRPDRPVHVLALSAAHDAALGGQAAAVRDSLERHVDVPIGDVCYTINTGRRHLDCRLAVTAGDRRELLHALGEMSAGRAARGCIRGLGAGGAKPTIAFLFTGQGSQYPRMGQQLYDSQPVFREALNRCAATLDQLLERPLLDVLFAAEGSADADLLHQTGYTQPALFALGYALSELWRSWGVTPDFVLGHSVGEITAMCVAGGVSLEDGLKLIAARGRLMQALPPGGVMTSVMADERRVLEALAGVEDSVAIAAINAPGQVVISGAGAAVAEVAARLTAEGVKTKSLVVSHAFHSPLMKPILADYERVVREISFVAPRVPFVSGINGALAGDEVARSEYWLRNVLEPVRFAAGAKTLEAHGVTAYIEVGPHPVLLGMTRQCISNDDHGWLPSLRKDADAWQTLAGSLAELYVRGADIDWTGFDRPYSRARVSAPPYRFERKQYWIRSAPALVSTEAAAPDPHRPGLYELTWRKATDHRTGTENRSRTWIVVADRDGVGRALAASAPVRSTNDTCLLVDDGQAALRALQTLSASPHPTAPPYIVDLRGTEGGPVVDEHRTQRILHDAVALAQGVMAARAPAARLWMVTKNAVALHSAAGVALAAAPLWGLGRTVALECPEHWGGMVDVSFDTPAAAAQALAAELLREDDEDQIALSAGGRYVARLARMSLNPADADAFSSDGTYLVTGGLGALGLHVARWLVARGARRLVLASRRGTLDERLRSAIADLQAVGASVSVASVDVSRADDVDRLIADIVSTSRLRGIIHAAGVDRVVPLAAVSAPDVSAALAGKATGAWLLHERTRDLDLELFVCFSSMSSLLGAQGRAHYAAANAFLDALAAERRRCGLAATSVSWGPWRGGGMASDEELSQFSQIGNHGLDHESALHVLGALLKSGTAHAMVADVEWQRFRHVYEARRRRPIVAEVDEGAPELPAAALDPAAPPWLQRLQAVPPGERPSELAGLLRHEVADTLGFDSPDAVPAEKSFYDLGMDSLMMAELVGRLRNRVGVSCTGLVFDHPSVSALAERLCERLAIDAAVSATPGSAVPEPQGPTDRPVGFDPSTEAEILSFQRLAYPRRRADWVGPRWRWMFVDSAARLGVEPRFWLHRHNGAIVGQTGSIPVRLKVGDEHLDTGWLVDTIVLEAYRHQAIGSKLIVDAHQDQPFSLSLGQTAEMREIQLRLGWKQVAPLQIAQLILNPRNVLNGKIPAPAAWAADVGFRASSMLRGRAIGRSAFRTAVIDRFDDRHDALWAAAAEHLPCAVVRDASYLNWKYVAQPGQDFLRLQICDSDGIKGVAVWMLREPDGDYRYRRAFLMDVIGPFADSEMLQRIIGAACATVAERGVDALLCHHTNPRLTRALRACGFHLRRPERFLLVSPGPLSGPMLDCVLTPDNWLVTHGDSDIDRPW